MPNREATALLLESLEFLNDHPNFGLRRNPRRTTYDLASRIERYLSATRATPTDHVAVTLASIRWKDSATVRIETDERETCRAGDDVWVRAWVLVAAEYLPFGDPPPIAIDVEQYRAAVMTLPDITRMIFLLHAADGLDCASIALKTGLPLVTVEQQVRDAILQIDRALRRPGDTD